MHFVYNAWAKIRFYHVAVEEVIKLVKQPIDEKKKFQIIQKLEVLNLLSSMQLNLIIEIEMKKFLRILTLKFILVKKLE